MDIYIVETPSLTPGMIWAANAEDEEQAIELAKEYLAEQWHHTLRAYRLRDRLNLAEPGLYEIDEG